MSPRRISFLSGSTETTPGDPEPEMGWGAGKEVSESIEGEMISLLNVSIGIYFGD